LTKSTDVTGASRPERRISSHKKMYGCYDAALVYGFMEVLDGYCIDEDWLRSQGLTCYVDMVIRNHGCNPIYGLQGTLAEDGQAFVSEENRRKVEEVYQLYKAHCLKEESASQDPKFHVGLCGDYEIEWCFYEIE